MKCQIMFFFEEKTKKKYFSMSSAENFTQNAKRESATLSAAHIDGYLR